MRSSRSNRRLAAPVTWVLSATLTLTMLGAPVRGDAPQAIYEALDIEHPEIGKRGMVVSQEGRASKVGLEILARGGNAFDAAAAVGFTLAVTLPRAGNLGGGGFMVAHLGESGELVTIDFREMAPRAAHRDMFLDAEGEVDELLAQQSHRSAGVPGSVAGLLDIHARWGSLPRADILAPAIRLAKDGLIVTHDMARILSVQRPRFTRTPASAAIFLRADGEPHAAGDRLVQRDLAWSLERIAEHGKAAFYGGAIGRRLVADMETHGGLITQEDLEAYRTVERAALVGRYRGHEVVSMPPPSSGGIHLIQMLGALEHFPLGDYGAGSADSIHVMAEVMKQAYADRAEHLGDPAFHEVPVAWLTSADRAREIASRVERDRARPAREISAGRPAPRESPDTTHYSIVDRFGNAVAITTTLNFSFGSGIVAEGTGILLNNEMDDFSAKPGVPNAYGLIGGVANAIAPSKRPLSSMTPTLVLREGKPFLITGSPGGSRIITTVLQQVVNVIDHGMNVAEAAHWPRMHHQWLPDELRIESGFSPDTLALLAAKGHRIVVKSAMGSTQSILILEDGTLHGAADPRRPDARAEGY